MSYSNLNSNLQRDYPYLRLGYNTLNRPSTFTDYCYFPDCPNVQYPINKFNKQYTQAQIKDFVTGIKRYTEGYKSDRDDNLNGCPVFNSNMKMPTKNYF